MHILPIANRNGRIIIFVRVLLIVGFDALVQQRIEAHQEEHVDNEQRDDPDHNDHYHLDDGGVAVLVLAVTPRTDLLALALLYLARYPWQNYAITVALVRWYVVDDQHPIGALECRVVHRLYAGADAFAAFVLVRLALSRCEVE
uniref:Uncharacterized protein n=1 Tax=Anopheles braziliensis TaxID=58242 RepID=A0A2M3ZLS6_9DIPT